MGSISLFLVLGLGFRRYTTAIPLVGSWSAGISAACHPPQMDTWASQSEVQWGVVSHDTGVGDVGHCSFTSGFVTPPVEGRLYAGGAGRLLQKAEGT